MENEKEFKDILKEVDKVDFNDFIQELKEKIKQEKLEKIEFAEGKGYLTFNKLSHLLDKKRNHYIDLQEDQEDFDKDYCLLFDMIDNYAKNNNKYSVDEDNYFPHRISFIRFKYKIYEFFIMSGQGTYTSIEKLTTESSLNMVSIIDFNDIINYYKSKETEQL